MPRRARPGGSPRETRRRLRSLDSPIAGNKRTICDRRRLRGSSKREDRAAEAKLVSISHAGAPCDALTVEKGAISRQAVVDDDRLAANALQFRVEPRDLRVPGDCYVHLRGPITKIGRQRPCRRAC